MHPPPLINIVTRMSRKGGFVNCRKSIDNQTYKAINHIVTVENKENEEFVRSVTDEKNTSICNVVPLAHLPDMCKSLWYHQHTSVSDLKKWDYKVWDGVEPTDTHASFAGSRIKQRHFPYNVYMVKAERFIKDGWVIYIDDDDCLCESNSLETVVNNIIKFDEDTIHWMQIMKESGELHPPEYVINHLSGDMPPALHLICSSNFCFHSKWLSYTAWEGWRGDDYRTASSLAEAINKNNSIMGAIIQRTQKE